MTEWPPKEAHVAWLADVRATGLMRRVHLHLKELDGQASAALTANDARGLSKLLWECADASDGVMVDWDDFPVQRKVVKEVPDA